MGSALSCRTGIYLPPGSDAPFLLFLKKLMYHFSSSWVRAFLSPLIILLYIDL